MWRNAWRSLVDLFYPRLCLICESHIATGSLMVCPACRLGLPLTGFHQQPDNPFEERFWGRFPFVSGTAFLYFRKGGITQQLLHQFKYKNRPELGVELGRLQGYDLQASERFAGLDLIVPVPLHPRKERERGYNQSACFGSGLAEALTIPMHTDLLIRKVHTESQTRKSRFERLQNMERAFELPDPAALEGRHVLLVDDVLTTGATLEACALELLAVPGLTVSLCALAFADF